MPGESLVRGGRNHGRLMVVGSGGGGRGRNGEGGVIFQEQKETQWISSNGEGFELVVSGKMALLFFICKTIQYVK